MTGHSDAMDKDLTQQLEGYHSECFSLQLEESTGVSHTAQLCINIRMVFTDMIAKNELLIELMNGRTHARRGHISVFQKLY